MEYLPCPSTMFHHHSHHLCHYAQWSFLHSADELLSLLCRLDSYAYSLQFLQVFFMGSVCIPCILFPSMNLFYISNLMISTFMIIIKFIFQTSFFSQYLSNGVWKIAGLVNEVSETIFVPDPFQWIHVIGIYKTANKYVCISFLYFFHSIQLSHSL